MIGILAVLGARLYGARHGMADTASARLADGSSHHGGRVPGMRRKIHRVSGLVCRDTKQAKHRYVLCVFLGTLQSIF